MAAPAYSVKPLNESTWDAFAALVERNNGIFGGCWCMGFHPEGAGKGTTPPLIRERKLERVRAGAAHAALVFDGDGCVGWCQFGVPDEVPRIKSRAAYEKLGFARDRKIGKHRWVATRVVESAVVRCGASARGEPSDGW